MSSINVVSLVENPICVKIIFDKTYNLKFNFIRLIYLSSSIGRPSKFGSDGHSAMYY